MADRCPVSTTCGEEAAWLDLFAMWSSGAVQMSPEWWAKDLDAIAVLANEAKCAEEHDRASAG